VGLFAPWLRIGATGCEGRGARPGEGSSTFIDGAQVLDYFTVQKVEHSQYVRDAIQGHLVRAVIREQSIWAIVKTDCSIVFRFDDHDRHMAYEVRERLTGP
jgi:hypothetical protein